MALHLIKTRLAIFSRIFILHFIVDCIGNLNSLAFHLQTQSGELVSSSDERPISGETLQLKIEGTGARMSAKSGISHGSQILLKLPLSADQSTFLISSFTCSLTILFWSRITIVEVMISTPYLYLRAKPILPRFRRMAVLAKVGNEVSGRRAAGTNLLDGWITTGCTY